jgi:hypothetical protein
MLSELDLLAWQAELMHACEEAGVKMPTVVASPRTQNVMLFYGDVEDACKIPQVRLAVAQSHTYTPLGMDVRSPDCEGMAHACRLIAQDFKENAHKYYPEELCRK